MSVPIEHLHRIYADSDDPWNFAESAYEQGKFRATAAALSRPHYAAALEIGCGNGALARHLAPRCASYTGIDAVAKAIAAARRALPNARFEQRFFPCPLPPGAFDLIIISEFLYFLSPPDILDLAERIIRLWPDAELLCVSYLGDTGDQLSGEEALCHFIAALAGRPRFETCRPAPGYRIDRGLPEMRG
ncbi:class I SAM-dependent methyltransferase [Sulfitobacter aestuarii]|uniref:Class I SAM-dependent methyltransferase n=1 Tax=Sulfitobacter aestuarii TaxID=2161676 RepID=A0ABW5U2M3_9RHOB